ncbi:hypothetical protein ANANG_G00292780 [Anguilla anguilla]|uniref:LITAF domain-containing protein n=1 Tax=Anguilla anguilla TaxID=7936 RepID=A0A9D3LKC5_ANGAN|nr:hypothetical protein ANANG_G00292780 [Anguilla anguilla]
MSSPGVLVLRKAIIHTEPRHLLNLAQPLLTPQEHTGSFRSITMEKGQGPPQDVPPPYTGPPANYRGTESAPQPGFSVPPYQGAPNPVMYPPPTQGMGAAGVISFPQLVHLISGLSDLPSQTQCPFCQTLVVSRTIPQPGLLTWLICGSLALV